MSFEHLLRHSDAYSWVVSGSEGFLHILRNFLKFQEFFEAFCSILIDFEWFGNVSEHLKLSKNISEPSRTII